MKSYRFVAVDRCCMCLAPKAKIKFMGLRCDASQGLRPFKSKKGLYTTVLRCQVCGLIFSSPRPEPTTVEQHYDLDPSSYFSENQMSREFDSSLPYLQELKSLLSRFEEPLHALDIGAGTGRNLLSLIEQGFIVTGIEPSKSFYNKALINLSNTNAKIINQKIENVEFPPETFHLIVLNAVLEHFYEPDKVLEKVGIILKPGGIALIEVPNSKWLLGRLLNVYHKLTFSRLVTNLSPMHKPFHLYEFSLESFKAYIHRTGNFRLQRFEYLAGEMPALGRLGNRLLKPILSLSNYGLDLIVVLRK